MAARVDLTGRVFSRLTVLHRSPTHEQWGWWVCQCECGKTPTVWGNNLKNGNIKSCGCWRKESYGQHRKTHGLTDSAEFAIWNSMWQRCTNVNHEAYHLYKDRKPPENWRDFQTFYRDMGPRPSPDLTLERMENDKPYGPDNCKWATRADQHRNTSQNVWVEFEGKKYIATDFAKLMGVSKTIISKHLKTMTPDQIAQHYRTKK